ncbi:formyltransferase family protein [Sedimenticola hydrogenitrophicus]|uniref:formyltransferase family protein n=1 Tax=Sedimenticola hydrogenitrophicus TaxID=2967975 RepID=UPI0023B06EBF|nr:formyltransferase family protein [Sedimenticola hydrogenitrophicus]
MLPESVILLGGNASDVSKKVGDKKEWEGILLPDLNESVASTCEHAEVPIVHVAENDVNAELTHEAISIASPDILIYSGSGGQIVSEKTLALGPKFLHMHSGWLPDYRGSTTLYYAMLEGKLPAVSAIILDSEIDTGPVVAQRHYPRPSTEIDIDRVYDSAIRADLMARVLVEYKTTGQLPAVESQFLHRGTPYYVIHPILKHLSILSLRQGRCQ